jgi:type II secretory pathway pseudopilin PulG
LNFTFQPRKGYILLETVIATGLLIVGLGVVGAQLQDSNAAVRRMRLQTQAVLLAESQLAMLDLGLIELESADEVEEGDFGPRHPDWGWRLVTEPTAVDGLYRITLDVLHLIRDEDYREDTFDHDEAHSLHRAVAFRQPPRPLDLAADFGMTDEEMDDFLERVGSAGIPGFENGLFDPTFLANAEIEELLKLLPALQELGISLGDLESMIPPDLLQQLQDSGFLEQLEEQIGVPGTEPET